MAVDSAVAMENGDNPLGIGMVVATSSARGLPPFTTATGTTRCRELPPPQPRRRHFFLDQDQTGPEQTQTVRWSAVRPAPSRTPRRPR